MTRTATDIVDQFNDNPDATVRARNTAEKIDRAAESMNGLRARVDNLKSAQAVTFTHELVPQLQAEDMGTGRSCTESRSAMVP